MTNTRLLALLAVALVVLAGCSGLTPTDPTTQAPSESSPETTPPPSTTAPPATQSTPPKVTVKNRGATLGDVNATKVWQRVGELVSVEYSRIPAVYVYSTRPANGELATPPLYQSFGVSAREDPFNATLSGGYYNTGAHIELGRAPLSSDTDVESVLSHELAHAYQASAFAKLPRNTTDFVTEAVKEGSAQYVMWRYADRYMSDYDRESVTEDVYEEAGPARRLDLAPYLFGAQYVRNHTESGAPFESIYEQPPTTAEQVLHGLEPGSEQPKPLAVQSDNGGNWSARPSFTKRMGEIHVRLVLEEGVSSERAATAAAGWGNDRQMQFSNDLADAHAWVLRWDSLSEAREFESALADYQQNVSVPLDFQTVGEETTVVFTGSESFVGNATASGTAGNVTVST